MAEITQLRNLKDTDPFADLDELAVDMDAIEVVGETGTSPDALWGKALSEELERDEEKDADDADTDERDDPSPAVAQSGAASAAPADAAPEPPEPAQPEPAAAPAEFIAAIGAGTDADVADRREQAIAHLSERFPQPIAEVAQEPVPAVVDPDGPPPGAQVLTYDPETGKPESWATDDSDRVREALQGALQEVPRRRGRPRKIVGAPEPQNGAGEPRGVADWADPDRGHEYRMAPALEVSRIGEIETRPSVNVTLNITHFHGNAEAVTELVKGLSAALASMLDKEK